MSNLGWNEGTWGNNPWGGRITVAVTVSGLSATASTNDIPQCILMHLYLYF